MNKKEMRTALRKYDFHFQQAQESFSTASEQLEKIVLSLMRERKIPDNKITALKVGDSFIHFFSLKEHLFFRYYTDDFESGYYDGEIYCEWSRYNMILIIEHFTGKKFGELLCDKL